MVYYCINKVRVNMSKIVSKLMELLTIYGEGVMAANTYKYPLF